MKENDPKQPTLPDQSHSPEDPLRLKSKKHKESKFKRNSNRQNSKSVALRISKEGRRSTKLKSLDTSVSSDDDISTASITHYL